MEMDHLSPRSPRPPALSESLGAEQFSKTLTVANDGYDYTDAGEAPEDAPTTGRQAGQLQKVESSPGDPKLFASSRRVPESTLRLFIRWIDGGWRPEIPDEESATVQTSLAPGGNAPGSADISNPAAQERISDYEIMHNWTHDKDDDESVFHLNVVHHIPGNVHTAQGPQKVSMEGHIRWIHLEEDKLTHAKFEDVCSRYAYRHVGGGVRNLTRRLLKRVWATDERDFVGGKFLNSATTRYDGQSKNDDEKPCTFFNFPYFSVQKPNPKLPSQVDLASPSLEHSVRTLHQSRYRLEATDDRDLDQAITKLSRSDVRMCIHPLPSRSAANVDNQVKPIIHVPQLWCLSLSGDVMVTTGPISESDLRGSAVITKNVNILPPQAGPGPALVRIFLEHSSKQPPVSYPVNQCDWWFGLLNKQRHILRSLGDDGETEVKFGDYKFYTSPEASSEYLVDIYNWHDILKQEESETLDLWIKRTVTVPNLTITRDTNHGEPNVSELASSLETSNRDLGLSSARPEASTLGLNTPVLRAGQVEISSLSTSVVTRTANAPRRAIGTASISPDLFGAAFQPFFEWPFLNDEGKLDKRSPEDRVGLWLYRIHRALQTKYGTMIEQLDARGHEPVEVLPHEDTAHAKQNIIRRCSDTDVHARLKQAQTNKSQHVTTMERLCGEAGQLFQLFVRHQPVSNLTGARGSQQHIMQPHLESNGMKAASGQAAIELYWGTVDAIMLRLSQLEGQQVEVNELVQGLRQITSAARELHFGMRTLRSVHIVGRNGSAHVEDSEVKLLLEVIVDAFEAAFSVLIGTVRYLWTFAGAPDGGKSKISTFIGKHVRESCRLLVVAKARLVVEADEINHDKDLGPVVTPEAIIIMLVERLTRGVYLDATIDVMDLYEKIVEKIALKVEKNASRRLLLEINRVSEELDIINDVLRQQNAVLSSFRESLDPATFKTRSIPRRMRFQYESKSIDKILKAIQESIVDCTELRERASRLAVQNVQLVETKLEDNGKAIVVFTVVTIFFLPLSFVTGFFGMNLVGINPSTSTVKHFWVIALPLTFGVVFLCLFAAFSGYIRRWIERRARRRKEKKN